MTFYDYIEPLDWNQTTDDILSKTADDVRRAIDKRHRNLDDFKALISPAARPFLEEMAREARRLTLERFGNIVQLYIPLYLSNYCHNSCVYCGFSTRNKIARKMLTLDEVAAEAEAIKKLGYKHILLVSGDAPSKTIGQYQHDMNQKKLNESLSSVVEKIVNEVGVDLNTASYIWLLRSLPMLMNTMREEMW